MNTVIRSAFYIICILSGIVSVSYGHGTAAVLLTGGTGVQAWYDNGNPMAGVQVEIRRAADQSLYQSGVSDPAGRFVFMPDTSAVWTVSFDDGMGHTARMIIEAGPDGAAGAEPPSDHRLSGTVIGLCVLFGVFGLAALRKKKPAAGGSSACT